MSVIKKENITIVVDTYMKDGQEKKVYKTVGELITMQGNDGPYQFGRMWGPNGSTEFKVFDQQEKAAPMPQQVQQQMNQIQPQGGYQQPQQQPKQQAPQGYNQPNNGHNQPPQY